MTKPRHTYAMLALLAGALFTGCVKENEKAAEDDAAYYDYRVSKDMIFFDREVGNGNRDIFSYRVATANLVNRTETPDVNERFPAASHNLKRMAFTEGDVIVHSDLSGNDRTYMPSGAFVSGNFRPGHLSWTNRSNYLTLNDRSNQAKVYFVFSDYNQETPEAFTEGFELPADGNVSYPVFYGEENRVCYVRTYASGWAIETATSSGYDAEAEEPVVVYSATSQLTAPRVSVKGDKIVFNQVDATGIQVCVVNMDGSGFAQLTSGNNNHLDPCFSANGKQVAFAADLTGDFDIYTMNVDGSNVQNVTNSPSFNEMHPYWN